MKTALIVLAAALALAGCGDDKAKSPPAAPPPTVPAGPVTVPLTRDPQVIASALKNAATAEESFFVDHGTYTAKVTDLEAEGYPAELRVRLRVISATKTRYCLSGEGRASLRYYYDSKVGQYTRTPCT